MSLRDTYIDFISYFLDNLSPLIAQYEKKDLLKDNLGSGSLGRISLPKLKKLALSTYYVHFIDMTFGVDAMRLIGKSSVTDLRELLTKGNDLREEYGIGSIPVVYYTPEKQVIKHMKEFKASQTILSDLLGGGKSMAVARKSTKKKPATRKTVRKTAGKQCNEYSVKELRDMAADRGIKGRSKMNKAALCRALKISGPSRKTAVTKKKRGGKPCKEYTLKELRPMAAEASIRGRSKMNKNQLCKALKIDV